MFILLPNILLLGNRNNIVMQCILDNLHYNTMAIITLLLTADKYQ